MKVDLVGLAQECCPELDLKAELERSFLSEPSSPGHTKAPKGFRLGKHKHETFITSRLVPFFLPFLTGRRFVFNYLNDGSLLLFATAVNPTMWSLPREPTSWLPLVAAAVEEASDRISAGRMTSSVSASRTHRARPACMLMTLWPPSSKTLQHLSDFCPRNGPQRAFPSPPLEGSSPATEAELLSTTRLASSLHHSRKGFCCPVRVTS